MQCPTCHKENPDGAVYCMYCATLIKSPEAPPPPPVPTIVQSAKGERLCQRCGSSLSPTAKFCENCGQEYAPAGKNCLNCGLLVPAGSDVCPHCGFRVYAHQPASTVYQQPSNYKSQQVSITDKSTPQWLFWIGLMISLGGFAYCLEFLIASQWDNIDMGTRFPPMVVGFLIIILLVSNNPYARKDVWMRRFRTLFWLNMISGLSLFGALIYLNYDSAGEVGGLIFLNILVFIYLISS